MKDIEFLNKLLASFPHLELWLLKYYRHVDSSSAKLIKEKDGFYLFNLPEALLKTAQIGSLIEKSQANTGKIIKTKHQPMTLSAFRKRYDLETFIFDFTIKAKKKVQFGTYTLFKSKKL